MALAREDAQFITWEHPLIRNGSYPDPLWRYR
ncbi:hypothetical protein ACLB1E_33115 [Escherichia coli]